MSNIPTLKPARVNLAILTYNALDYTKMCLESIARNTRVEHNVFVLDNGSTDGSREWLRQHKAPNFYFEEAVKNGGVPGGRNRLIEIITPFLPDDGFVAFSDNDMEMKEGWDEDYLAFFDAHPEAGILSAFGHRMIVRQYHRELLPPPLYTAAVDVACGGFACWVRAAAIRKIGGFDENLGLFWHEDDDFSLRAIAAGFDVYAMPHAKVVHHEHKSGAANPGIKSGGSPKNQIYLCEKWRNLGLVDREGRIVRKERSRDWFSRKSASAPDTSLNMGGYCWVRPQTVINLDSGDSLKAGESVVLSCGRKEFYDQFPFSVEVSSAAGTMRFTFSDSDETHEFYLPAGTRGELKITSSASFSPALAGLGSQVCGAVSLRLASGPRSLAVQSVESKPQSPLVWMSSLFDTDGYADLSRSILPALRRQMPDLSFECLSLNEQVVTDLTPDRDWMRQWHELFKECADSRVAVAACDPLDANGLSEYRRIRQSHPTLERLIGFVLVDPARLTKAWVDAALAADELWVLSEREHKLLLDAGVPAEKVAVAPWGVPEEFTPRQEDPGPLSLIDGQVCVMALVNSSEDPFLSVCVRGAVEGFSKDDRLALLVSLAPTGAQLPPNYIRALCGNAELPAEERAPVYTVSPFAAPAAKRNVFEAVHCCVVSTSFQRRSEVQSALACGLPVIEVDSTTGACRELSLADSFERSICSAEQALVVPEMKRQVSESLTSALYEVKCSYAEKKTIARKNAWNAREKLSMDWTVAWISGRVTAIQSAPEKETQETLIRVNAVGRTIGIDARTLTYAETRERGIGHYTVHHLEEIFRQRPEWTFILYCNAGETSDVLEKLLHYPNVKRGVMGDQHGDELDLYHIADPMTILPGFDSPFLAAPVVPSTAVFFDLIPLVKREMHFDCWEAWTKKAYSRRLDELARSGTVVLPISECSKVDLNRLTGFPLNRAVTIMAGVNRGSLPDRPTPEAVNEVRKKFGLSSSFFLSVGGLDGHKGFLATAQAYATLRSTREFQFAVVGSLNDPYKARFREIFEANKIPSVVFTGYVSREEMTCLYAAASGLVFPSHYEGFGFPVLEAMASGCPVITTNVSSLPEVAGDAGILVGIDDAQGIQNAMRRLLEEPGLRASMSERGLAQAGKFSWKKSAEITLKVWSDLMGEDVAVRPATSSSYAPN